eukprot:XP_764446.1 hypothetical protein [Theileria parva strain Muguga]
MDDIYEYNDSNSCDKDSNFDEDLNEAIKQSLQDYREGNDDREDNSGSPYVNFNPDGTYFLSNLSSKGPDDTFDPTQILDIVLFYFKDYINSLNDSSVSSRFPRNTHKDFTSESTGVGSTNVISTEVLSDLLTLLFGNDSSRLILDHEIRAWCNQGFVNDPNSALFWGLTQMNNGCCGVLASIQSFMLRSLLFNHSIFADFSFLLQSKNEEEALILFTDLFFNYITIRFPDFSREFLYVIPLIESCSNVLYNSTETSSYKIILFEDLKENADPLTHLTSTNSCTLRSFDNINSVANYLVRNFEKLTGPLGVVSLVLSVICTRTLERVSLKFNIFQVKEDMDDPTQPLLTSFGHCSQELVNLFLHGKAVSNVFNGDKLFEGDSSQSMVLKGIISQNTLGFLTDLEAMRLYKVGSFYKNPLVPIWVVCSSNHYTVLFGLDGTACFFSRLEMVEQSLVEEWSKLDVDDNKYIPVKSLSRLLNLLGIPEMLQDAVSSMDVDSGIVLWTNMLEWYKSKVLSQHGKYIF